MMMMRRPQRYIPSFTLAVLVVLCSTAHASDEDSEPAQPGHVGNFPRFFGVFSRPKPEAEKETNMGLKHHFGNVLQGGSIGFQAEFNPIGKIHGIIDHAKKFIPFPGIPPNKGSGNDDEIYIPEKKPDNHENVESDDIFGWEPKDPKVGKPKPDGPKWEDIGEEEGGESEDYEDLTGLIHPRRRPKRFIESKVYHVPLEFLSNAKPVEVKVQSENHF